jgi:PqqD family protein of HPr-rel-A system
VAAPTRWRALDPDLIWRHWTGEDEWVVYSPRSASVHLLNEAAARLVQLAAERPHTAADLARALAQERSQPQVDDFMTAVEETIAGLDAAGLLAPDRGSDA